MELIKYGISHSPIDSGEYLNGDIVNWGKDNIFPNWLKSLRYKSVMHQKILDTKIKLASGYGWMDLPEEILNNFDSPDDLNDILVKIMSDLIEFGGFAIKLTLSNNKTNIVDVDFIPLECLRVVLPKSKLKKDIEFVKISDWTKNDKKEKYRLYTEDIEVRSHYDYLVYYYNPSNQFYPISSWISAQTIIELEHEIDKFYINSIKNGFFTSKLISIYQNADMTPEEKIDEIRGFRRNLEGSSNVNKVLFQYFTDKDQIPSIQNLSDQNVDHSKFVTLQNDRVSSGIMTAHGITNPALMGIRIPGQLGSSKELIDSLMIFQSIEIDPLQKLIEDTFKYIKKIDFTINKFKIYSKIEGLDVITIIKDNILSYQQKYALLEELGYNPTTIQKLIIQ